MKFQYIASVRVLVALLCLVGVAFVGTGCGKKGWPKPKISSEEFKWQSVMGSVQEDCLVVVASLSGTWTNVEAVALELADAEDCLGCPFNPVKRVELARGDSGFVLKSPSFSMRYCPDVGPEGPPALYRWRLMGRNQNHVLGDVPSPVRMTRAR